MQTYHSKFKELYKQNVAQYVNTVHPQVQYFCLEELKRIRHQWVNQLQFNIKELDDITPDKVKQFL